MKLNCRGLPGLRALAASLLLAGSAPAMAAESVNCAAIADARERLACYDNQNPPGLVKEPPQIESEVITPRRAPPRAEEAVGTVPPTPPAPGDGATPSRPSTAEERAGLPTGRSMFDWSENVRFDSKILAVRRRESQKMVFQLENEQIWIQSTPRQLDIREGQTVTIASGKLGGFLMTTEKGVTTRVQRLQ